MPTYSAAPLFVVVPFFFFSLVYCLDQSSTVALSSLSYPDTTLHPYQLRYIRVDLPQWFSSLSITVESDVDLNLANVEKVPKSMLPMICFRDGSPPLPDVTNTSVHGLVLAGLSNQSIGRIEGTQDIEQCYPMQKNITVKLTNEQKINFWTYPIEHPDCCFVTLLNSPLPIQISPGVWYFGLFNGIGPIRTQSKMIIRGDSYSFSANITVDGCIASTVWGNYCNQTISPLTCSQPVNYNHTIGSLLSCKNSLPSSCTANGEVKVYTFDILGVAEEVNINIKFNATSPNITDDGSLMFFVRNGAIASDVLYDYSSNVSNLPLVIRHPKVGHWFVTVSYRNSSKQSETSQTPSAAAICYSLEVQVVECPTGQAGHNCLWKRYDLKTILRPAVTFESYYLPTGGNMSSTSPNFPLEPLLSNSSGEGNETWTYFVLDVPRGAAGGNIHIHLTSDSEIINYETYMRYGGMPSLSVWDYYYANKTSSSYDSSTFFMLNNSTEDKIDFYILYAREGTWTLGLRNLNITATEPTTMSISFERCPRKCSSHGDCKSSLDFSGLTSYSYCSCDRTHGGFDCSIELVSPRGHVVQSIFLIASNVAAILPAFWALRQKAFAEWVLFTASGISSGLYHACDVGTWCALSFSVLQFMDFWLSFMAVVSTFVFLTTIDEVHKRTIHTVVAILTALMAITKATRSSNIILVMGIGALGLLIGWLIELTTKFRTISLPVGFCLNLLEPDRWQIIKRTMRNLVKRIIRRFHWWFMIPGFALLFMAGISWKLETSESYWIWHSVWHVTIYTSSFFFLCSKPNPVVDGSNQRATNTSYELTRQDSSSRAE